MDVSFANEIIMDATIFYREIASQIHIQLPTIKIRLYQCDTSSDKPKKNCSFEQVLQISKFQHFYYWQQEAWNWL
jgi:hypothetical protein